MRRYTNFGADVHPFHCYTPPPSSSTPLSVAGTRAPPVLRRPRRLSSTSTSDAPAPRTSPLLVTIASPPYPPSTRRRRAPHLPLAATASRLRPSSTRRRRAHSSASTRAPTRLHHRVTIELDREQGRALGWGQRYEEDGASSSHASIARMVTPAPARDSASCTRTCVLRRRRTCNGGVVRTPESLRLPLRVPSLPSSAALRALRAELIRARYLRTARLCYGVIAGAFGVRGVCTAPSTALPRAPTDLTARKRRFRERQGVFSPDDTGA